MDISHGHRWAQVAAWFVLDSDTLLQHPGPATRLEGRVRRVTGGLSAADAAAVEAVLGTVEISPLDALKMDEERLEDLEKSEEFRSFFCFMIFYFMIDFLGDFSGLELGAVSANLRTFLTAAVCAVAHPISSLQRQRRPFLFHASVSRPVSTPPLFP